jgi:hypothetical protein
LYLFFFQDLTSLSYNPTSITKEEYFSELVDLGERDIGRPLDQTTKTQKFKATLWLCEDYPLSLQQQVVPIIDLMSASNAHFKKLRDFITLQLPAGFPIKMDNYHPSPALNNLNLQGNPLSLIITNCHKDTRFTVQLYTILPILIGNPAGVIILGL